MVVSTQFFPNRLFHPLAHILAGCDGCDAALMMNSIIQPDCFRLSIRVVAHVYIPFMYVVNQSNQSAC